MGAYTSVFLHRIILFCTQTHVYVVWEMCYMCNDMCVPAHMHVQTHTHMCGQKTMLPLAQTHLCARVPIQLRAHADILL